MQVDNGWGEYHHVMKFNKRSGAGLWSNDQGVRITSGSLRFTAHFKDDTWTLLMIPYKPDETGVQESRGFLISI